MYLHSTYCYTNYISEYALNLRRFDAEVHVICYRCFLSYPTSRKVKPVMGTYCNAWRLWFMAMEDKHAVLRLYSEINTTGMIVLVLFLEYRARNKSFISYCNRPYLKCAQLLPNENNADSSFGPFTIKHLQSSTIKANTLPLTVLLPEYIKFEKGYAEE